MKKTINEFIADKHIAIIGVSRKREKWGNMLWHALKKKGYTVYPVNPHVQDIEGEKCYAGVKELPIEVTNVVITTPPGITEKIIKECTGTNIRRVWMHKGGGGGAVSEEAIKYCKQNGIDVVYGFCPMMFFPPVGGHKIHFLLKSLFGKLPKEYTK